MKLTQMHEAQLQQMTGCRYKTLKMLYLNLGRTPKIGRPLKHGLWASLIVTLVKLCTDLPYLTLEILFHMDSVTLSRMVKRITNQLAKSPFKKARGMTILDTTLIRIKSTDAQTYSGYKKVHGMKIQAITDRHGIFTDISDPFFGRIHDKVIAEETHALKSNRLADKAYTGTCLKTPTRKNSHPDLSTNRKLSRQRIKIEHSFARLKSFRILGTRFSLATPQLSSVVKLIAQICNINRI